ncbi:12058_t:CDS:1, partial [Racocetra persica]
MWPNRGGFHPRDSYKTNCLPVLDKCSSPRKTWLIFIKRSSTTHAKLKFGMPFWRKSTKSSMSWLRKLTSPRTKSAK